MSIQAMKQALEALDGLAHDSTGKTGTQMMRDMDNAITALRAAIEAAERQEPKKEHVCGLQGFGALDDVCPACATPQPTERQEPVEFLANATRYKICRTDELGCHIAGLPNDLHGRWVALVAAEDGKHLKLTATQPAIPEGWLKEMPDILREAADILAEEKCMRFPIIDELRGFAAMLAATPKPGDKE